LFQEEKKRKRKEEKKGGGSLAIPNTDPQTQKRGQAATPKKRKEKEGEKTSGHSRR